MKKFFLTTTVLSLLSFNALAGSTMLINKEDLVGGDMHHGIKVTELEKSGNIAFSYCAISQNPDLITQNTECFLPLGNKLGYPKEILNEKIKEYADKENTEHIVDGLLIGATAVVGVLRWRDLRTRIIKRFINGSHIHSGLSDEVLAGTISGMTKTHVQDYSFFLVAALGYKAWFVDSAGEDLDTLEKIAGNLELNKGDSVIAVEEFDAEYVSDRLSKILR
jgi:hypothetical protein